jgi:trans-aconitate methyltransferase
MDQGHLAGAVSASLGSGGAGYQPDYAARVQRPNPLLAGGCTVFTFRRLFIVATRP